MHVRIDRHKHQMYTGFSTPAKSCFGQLHRGVKTWNQPQKRLAIDPRHRLNRLRTQYWAGTYLLEFFDMG